MNLRLKASLGLALLFAAGVGTGVVLAPHLREHEKMKPFPAQDWTESTVADYQARLHLAPAEEAKVRDAARAAATEILRIRGETQESIRTVIKQMNRAIIPALNEPQRAALEQWLEEKRAALQAK